MIFRPVYPWVINLKYLYEYKPSQAEDREKSVLSFPALKAEAFFEEVWNLPVCLSAAKISGFDPEGADME